MIIIYIHEMMLTTLILKDLLTRYKDDKEMKNLLLFYIRLKLNKQITHDINYDENMRQLYAILYKN
jgi:hypothetical protein